MYKQTLKNNGFFIYFGIPLVIAMLVSIAFLSYFDLNGMESYFEAGIFLLFLSIYLILYKRKSIVLTYMLINDEFAIKKVNKKTDKLLLSVHARDIIDIYKKHNIPVASEHDYSVNVFSHNKYVMYYQLKGKKHKILFEPNREMLASLRNAIKDKNMV